MTLLVTLETSPPTICKRSRDSLATGATRPRFSFLISLWFILSTSGIAQVQTIHELYGPEFLLTLKEAQELHDAAEGLYYKGDYIAAFQKLGEALTITKRSAGEEHRDVVNLLATMAEGYIIFGDPTKAAELLKTSLQMGEKVLGLKHPVIARILHDLAIVQFIQGNLPTAKSALHQCLAIQAQHYGTNHVAYAMSLQIEALILLSEGKISEAEPQISHSSEIIEKTIGQDTYQYAMSLYLQSVIALNQANFPTAIQLCQRSLSIFEKRVGPGNIMLTLVKSILARVYQQLGQYQQALALLKENLAILESTLGQENFQVALALNSLGLAYYAFGDFSEAERLFRRSLALRERYLGPDNPGYAATVNNLALVLIPQGKGSTVPEMFKNAALTLQKALGKDSPELATVLFNWGVFSEHLGQLEIADVIYKEAAEIRNKAFGEHHPEMADSLNQYASVQLKLGKTKYALSLAREALATRREFFPETHPAIADSLDLLARICAADGDHDEALGLLDQSRSIILRNFGPFHPLLANTLEKVAFAYQAIGEYPKALKALSETFPIRRVLLMRQVPRSTENDLNGMAEASLYRTDLFHSLLMSAPFDSWPTFAELGAEQVALNKGTVEELESIRAALEANTNTTTRGLREAYEVLQVQLHALDESPLEPVRREIKRRDFQDELANVETRLADRQQLLGQRLRERDLVLADVAHSLPLQSCLVDLIQFDRYDFNARTNKWRTARYAAYLTFPLEKASTNVVVKSVDLGEASPIDEAVELISQRLGAGQFRRKDLQIALERLSQLVYAPLIKHLTDVSHLIVCPDGQLSRVPFEMLPLPPFGPQTRYLLEEKTINYVSSGREIARLALPAAKEKTNGPVVMGNPDFDLDLPGSAHSSPRQKGFISNLSTNGVALTSTATSGLRRLSRSYRGIKFAPLPASEPEAKNVAKLLGSDCALRLGRDAREQELKSMVSPRVLHLATHGFFLTDQEFKRFKPTNEATDLLVAGAFATSRNRRDLGPEDDWENPMVRCGIALAGANHATGITQAAEEDGLLTGLEASLLNLQGTELVILSACESGAGEVKIGEGLMSLRRAFRIAGAETVVASHWKVSDKATSQLMTEFMRRWRSGEPRIQAWRKAQLSLLNSKDFSNPYFWAAFTLTGQWR